MEAGCYVLEAMQALTEDSGIDGRVPSSAAQPSSTVQPAGNEQADSSVAQPANRCPPAVLESATEVGQLEKKNMKCTIALSPEVSV